MNSKGFTLLEILIAAVILFAGLTVVAEGYRASIGAGAKAERTLDMLRPLPLIERYVQDQLRLNPEDRVEGAGRVMGVDFSYRAVTSRFKPPPPSFDPDVQDMVSFAPRYRLYEVTLVLTRGAFQREFIYQELAWTPALVTLGSP